MNGSDASDPKVLPLPLYPEVRDADLAAAAADLAAIAPEDELTPRPEWIEKVVAEATAARPPAAPRASQRRLQRWIAAAAAVVGIQTAAGAMTATAVGVATVTATVLVWTAGRNSSQTMTYELAVHILLNADHEDADRDSALAQVTGRVKTVVEALQAVRGEPGVDAALAADAAAALERLRAEVEGETRATLTELTDPMRGPKASLLDTSADPSVRRSHLVVCTEAASTGVFAILSMPACSESLQANRSAVLRRLTKQLGR